MKDRDGEYLLVNEGVKQLFGLADVTVRGQTDAELLSPAVADAVRENDREVLRTGEPIEREEQFTVEGEQRTFLSSKTPVYDIGTESDPADPVAVLGVATDITEQKTREQRLSVLNRVLRHNIRNDVTVMRGHLEVLAEALPEESDHVNAIERRIDNITELSERARHIEQLRDCGSEEDWTTFELSSILDDNRERLELDWPTATVTTTGPTATVVRGHELLPYAVENLLENAVEHNDGDDPSVHVEVSRKPRDPAHDVSLAIADDGPGLPAVERDVLTQDTERALSHSSGMGLWLTRWIVRSSGGDLHVEERRFGGTRVVVELQQPADTEGAE